MNRDDLPPIVPPAELPPAAPRGFTARFRHYFLTGKVITVVGILLSMGAAYFASMYDNAIDIIQLVFGFVNAPLFATFLLGMFWKRTTGTGAFLGLFGGIAGSTIFHALTTVSSNLDSAGHVVVDGPPLTETVTLPRPSFRSYWLLWLRSL